MTSTWLISVWVRYIKLREGQQIVFATKVSRFNRAMNKDKISSYTYDFKGVVSDIIDSDNAWVIVDEEALDPVKKWAIPQKPTLKNRWLTACSEMAI